MLTGYPTFDITGPASGKEMQMTTKLRRIRAIHSVFLDLGFPKGEAENLKLRSLLMIRVEDFYRCSGLTQAEAAKRLGITQPRLNALLKGRTDLFSLDGLVNMLARVGMTIEIKVRTAA
jgi:predicted XRE-type DNA-binding protein